MSDYNEHLISMAGGDGDPLAEIEARAGRATQGPWECDGFADGNVVSLALFEGTNQGRVIANSINTHADADFLLNARTDVPYLLALVRKQQATLDAVRDLANQRGRRGWHVSPNDIRATLDNA